MVLTFPCSPTFFPGYVISDIPLFGPTLSTQPFPHTNVSQDFHIRLQFELHVFAKSPGYSQFYCHQIMRKMNV